MFIGVTCLTDCYDDNARGRIFNRNTALLGAATELIPIRSEADLLAAPMNLVDFLSAGRPVSGIEPSGRNVLQANIARREKTFGKEANGVPFCYFFHGEHLVVSTYTPGFFRLAQALGLVDSVEMLDIHTVLDWAIGEGYLTRPEADEIEWSQFRSLEFVPLVSRLLLERGERVPSFTEVLGEHPGATGIVQRVDNFGNLFTDLLPGDVDFQPGGRLSLYAAGRRIPCYRRLAEVPKGQTAAVIGSSGYVPRRFIMVTIQGGSAERNLAVKPGDKLVFLDDDELAVANG
jgi:hypothetical protein